MIQVTRINRQDRFWVNENLIETMEATPDTILSLATGKKLAVAESVEEVAQKINSNWRAASPVAGVLARKLLEEEKM